ncbi:MAG: DUF262 domain-containing protein [Methylococcaceae bacterium]|jgi:uncharacterized protein with ParB-like and HNH nuclease domain
MSYESTTIAKIINKLNRNYFLPAIQRPYVWKPEQVIRLFDSLMKGYPISSFLFWDLKPENKQQWEIYKFVENFRYGDTHNEIAETDGFDVNLVLDGQQRLTSLMLGLRGSYTVKAKNKRINNPDAWTRQHLYIDLLKDPNLDDDEAGIEVSYGFKFFAEHPNNSKDHYWIKVGRILEYSDESQFDEAKDEWADLLHGDVTRDQVRLFKRNLDRLYRMVWKDESVAYFTEQSQSYDRVLDIFIRANDGGTKLSKSDLLLSMLTSKWDGVNAREEIFNFVEYVNNDLTLKNNFDKDFIMKSCFVLTDLPHAYKVANFTKENLDIIKNNWAKIKKTLEQTILLINSFGLDRDSLTSANALHPIAYYLHKTGKSLLGTTTFDVINSREIHRWLLIALLNNIFGGTSDSTIGLSKEIVKDNLSKSLDFPTDLLLTGLKTHGKYSSLNDDFIDDILQFTYSKNTAFLALSLIQDEAGIGNNLFHIDHIFPKSWFTTANLQSMGISINEIDAYQLYANSIANLHILLARENQEKSNQSLEEWIKVRDDDFKRKHCIPTNYELYKVENFLLFISERKKLIELKLRLVFNAK